MCNLEAELFSNGIICRVPQTDNSFQITQKEKLISAFECSMTFFSPQRENCSDNQLTEGSSCWD